MIIDLKLNSKCVAFKVYEKSSVPFSSILFTKDFIKSRFYLFVYNIRYFCEYMCKVVFGVNGLNFLYLKVII